MKLKRLIVFAWLFIIYLIPLIGIILNGMTRNTQGVITWGFMAIVGQLGIVIKMLLMIYNLLNERNGK